MREHWIEREGVRLFAMVEGSGPAVVLLPGALGTYHLSLPLLLPLADRYTVIAPELTGFGKSICHSSSRITWDALLADLLALLDSLEIEHAIVGGTSVGGHVSLAAALRVPQRVHGLVLISPSFLGNASGLLPEQEPTVKRLFEAGWRAATEGNGVFKPILQETSRSSPEMIDRLLSFHDPSSATAFFQGIEAEVTRQPFDHLAELHTLTMPCLIIPGSDAVHPTAVGEAYLRAIPQARGVFLPKEASPEERMRLMATELAAFCAKVSL